MEKDIQKKDEKKFVTIVVEGTPHEWPKGKIFYSQVVGLEVPDYEQHPEITYSVKYTHGPKHNHEGILSPGGFVEITEGMVFNVSETGQS